MKDWWWVPLALGVDQLSKAVVAGAMARGQSVPVLGDLFRLTYIHNAGAAFGVNLGSPLLHTLLSVLALLAMGWLYRSTPRSQWLVRLAVCLIVGGALGNIVDRLRLGQVVDFLDFGIGARRWPVFNLADSFITVGVLVLALASILPGARGSGAAGPEPRVAEPSTARQ